VPRQAAQPGHVAPLAWLARYARAALGRALADKPVALLIAWERPDGTIGVCSVPTSVALAEGLAIRVTAAFAVEPVAAGTGEE
jgi:hypothetical protein